MGYNVVLELGPEQKERLKLTAFKAHQTIRGFVTGLVVTAIGADEAQLRQSTRAKNKNKEVS